MRAFQRVLVAGFLIWLGISLAVETAARRREAGSPRPFVLGPRRWDLGQPYLEEVRSFALQVAERIPDGETVGLLANPRIGPGQRNMLRMWLAYLLPRQHVRLLPQFPSETVKVLQQAEAGSYVLAYRTRPARIPKLEAVFEGPLGGLYRVAP